MCVCVCVCVCVLHLSAYFLICLWIIFYRTGQYDKKIKKKNIVCIIVCICKDILKPYYMLIWQLMNVLCSLFFSALVESNWAHYTSNDSFYWRRGDCRSKSQHNTDILSTNELTGWTNFLPTHTLWQTNDLSLICTLLWAPFWVSTNSMAALCSLIIHCCVDLFSAGVLGVQFKQFLLLAKDCYNNLSLIYKIHWYFSIRNLFKPLSCSMWNQATLRVRRTDKVTTKLHEC